MEIKVIRVYNLVDYNGNKLRMRLGRINNHPYSGADEGYRWSFIGSKIPMPVRAYTWFNGFPEETMLDWLKENGWYPKTCVWMGDGSCHVYELPSFNEPSKGNETHKYVLPDWAIHAGERALREAVKMLYTKGSRIDAASLYRYVHPSDMYDANLAIANMMRIDNQQ